MRNVLLPFCHSRAQEPAQVDADTERIAIKLKRDAPAKVEFEVQVSNRFVADSGIESIIAHQVCGPCGYAGGGEALAVFRGAASIAFGGRSAPEYPANHRLIAPGRNIIGGSREAEIARIVFETTVELGVVAESDEGAVEELSVHHGVAHSGIEKR
jgi:hypothetical protein